MSTRAPIHRKTPIPFLEQQVVDDNPAVGSDEAMQSEQMDYEDEEYRHSNAVYEQEEEEEDDDEVTDDDRELRHNKEYLNKSRSVPRTPERRKLKPVAASPISLPFRNYSKNAEDSAGASKNSYKYTTTESTVTVQRKVQHTPGSAGISKRRNSISRAPGAPTPRKTERNRLFMPATALVLLAFVVCYALSEEFFGQGARNKKKEMKYCKFDDIRERYAQQDEFLWKSLSVGIENILNKRTHSPGIFLFVHELGAVDVNKLVKDIAKRSTECFGQPMQLVEMKPSDFVSNTNPEDYGTTIQNYRKKMEKGHVVLVANLNQIPPQAARALHAICDTVTPLKEDVVIFLTLTTPQIKGNIIELAENSLFDLWSSNLKRYELDPLITRVTDQVFALRSS